MRKRWNSHELKPKQHRQVKRKPREEKEKKKKNGRMQKEKREVPLLARHERDGWTLRTTAPRTKGLRKDTFPVSQPSKKSVSYIPWRGRPLAENDGSWK